MHTLTTTDAFVLGSWPHGESNRVYSLYTRAFGFLYAHGQGVRRLDNRNRYALTTGSLSSVTLVRGRDAWRITGAAAYFSCPGWIEHIPAKVPLRGRAAFGLLQSYASREEPSEKLFTLLFDAHTAHVTHGAQHGVAVELLTALRMLRLFGYIAPPLRDPVLVELLESQGFEETALTHAAERTESLTALVNNALTAASG